MKFKKTISALLSLAMSAGLTANFLSTSYLNVNAETITAKNDFLLGDVNGNGMVDAVDASSVLTYYAKTSTGKDGGFTETQLKAADMNENGLVDATDASAILTFYAKCSVDNGGALRTVELSNFKASVWDIYINTEETVKFTVDVTADEKLAEKAVALYDDSDNLVAYMNDDGKNGDEKANDGVYSVEKLLSADAPVNIDYYAAADNVKSDDYRVVFYRDLTKEDFEGFDSVSDDLVGLSFNEVCDYLEHSDKIESYSIDNDAGTIKYRTVYCISGLWEKPSSESTKTWGGNGLTVPFNNEEKFDQAYKNAESAFTNGQLMPRDLNGKGVLLLQPAASTMGDEFGKEAANCLAKVLDCNVTTFQDDKVDVELMTNLDGYDIVLVESHGIVHFGTEYIETGEKYNYFIDGIIMLESFSSAPFSGEIIVPSKEDKDSTEYRISINAKKFFDLVYGFQDEPFKDSLWFFSSCHGMEKGKMAQSIVNHGADAVIGFSNSVSNIYYQKMLYEIMINGMVLSGDTLGNSIDRAKDLHGKNDPNVKYAASEIRLKGNENYCLTDRIEIDFDFPEDTQNTTATTVPVATATTITTTKAASEIPPDLFGEKVYSMPGNIAISFSPIDAGTNRDPRTLDIITKLYNELDDSDTATYHSYTGAVTFSFSPKYTTDKGVEVGEYSSLGEILNCARSIDDTFSFFMSNLEEGEDSSRTAWVECYNNDFDAASGEYIHRGYSTREEKIYEYAKKDNEKFNMYSAIFGNKSFLCEGRNDTIITIVKDDYYYHKWNPFAGVLTKYSARMWYQNYFVNHEHDYGGTMVHYVIDLRPKYDAALRDMCGESGGKYIQYSEENLDKLIELINARRAYIDEYSRIQSEKWK